MWFRRTSRKKEWQLLARLFAGECDAREVQEIEAMIAVDKEAARRLAEAEEAWRAAAAPPRDTDAAAALRSLTSRLRQAERASPAPIRPIRNLKESRDRPPRSRLAGRRGVARASGLRVAAVLLAVAGLSFLTGRFVPMPVPDEVLPAPKVFTTHVGQRASIRLADGSNVMLNADSRLLVEPGFGDGSERHVDLDGEAYFEIAADSVRPFIVTTQSGRVHVLGTVFDVRAYAKEPSMQVVVIEGRVGMRLDDRVAAADTVVLHAHQMATVVDRRLQSVEQLRDARRYVAWTEGKLIFVDAPFAEVVRQLEKWYDLRIDVRGRQEAIRTFNGVFEDESLSEILNTVSLTLGLRYERNSRHITFYWSPGAAD